MDLSDLVHGLKPKASTSRDSGKRKSGSDESPQKNSHGESSNGRRAQHDPVLRMRGGQAGSSSLGLSGNARREAGTSFSPSFYEKARINPGSQKPRAKGKSPTSPSEDSSPSPPFPVRPSSTTVGSSSGGQVVVMCNLCNRTFDSKTKFDQHCSVFHRRSKVPSKPRSAAFPCPHCGKAFTSPSKMNVHQNATHKGLRPFPCDVCGKSFGYKGGMFSSPEPKT